MSSKATSLKAKIRNYAQRNNIAAQVVLQNYMFERLLERLSLSDYNQHFVIKGGMLIAAIVGLDTRSTMDLDVTLRRWPLSEEQILEAVEAICSIGLEDDVRFKVVSMAPIRNDDIYGGFCVRLNAIYETIVTPLSIDISTGDIITPDAVVYEFGGIFDEDLSIRLLGYNIETVMAEKVETILSRGVFNTRSRDYYDIYILGTTQEYDISTFKEALAATVLHRGSREKLKDIAVIIGLIAENHDLKQGWIGYQRKFTYAADISYESVMTLLRHLVL